MQYAYTNNRGIDIYSIFCDARSQPDLQFQSHL